MRLLILGTGGMANTHANHFKEIEGVEIVAAMDVDPVRVAAFAETHGIANTFTSLEPDVSVGGGYGYILPRLGVENETIPGRLRLRAGTFVEPSPFPGTDARPHFTGGGEVFLFKYYDRLSLSFSFDVANNYNNVGLALGFWR